MINESQAYQNDIVPRARGDKRLAETMDDMRDGILQQAPSDRDCYIWHGFASSDGNLRPCARAHSTADS